MKLRSNIYGWLMLIFFISIYSCKKTSDEVREHDDQQTHVEEQAAHQEPENKEVELNEAQYSASDIVLGNFEKKNLSEVINANGYTKLPPQNQADVSVFMPGIIKSIKVIEGQRVKAGETIATLESPEFPKLQEAYLTSESNLEYLAAEFERQKTLSEENVNAKKAFQKTKSDFENEKVRYNSLKKQLNMLHLASDGVGNISSTVAVTAPISGYITEVNIKIGSNVQPGNPLFSIVDNSKMHVDLLVYEKDLQKVKPNQTVRFVLTNQDNSEIQGKIFSVGKAFENETKSVAVHADILNDKQILIPGMYVNALIDIGKNEVNALPVDAVVKADGREFIFILEEIHDVSNKTGENAESKGSKKLYHFQRIEVKSGTAQLGYIQVTPLQTLNKDAKIVLEGSYYIQSHLLKSEGGGGHEH
ncbi:efflux RND transporter periplasmic adaptor subunit [Dyadobacter sp. CY345]|uniref:efflux RND transporter periplasmic adaptor subunit n=1 Tax=Dyadobacter sp. CY345 TaxID=2909335 RepID=UPI001F1CBF80|nr:efflux RND transporter periplasmic adaptor subunit [Dyadobacter sp. CY345]MCF2444476.1 efflux RND transporter periplasmic adaptor subunit [Dyadobacter sp. CY345]